METSLKANGYSITFNICLHNERLLPNKSENDFIVTEYLKHYMKTLLKKITKMKVAI